MRVSLPKLKTLDFYLDKRVLKYQSPAKKIDSINCS